MGFLQRTALTLLLACLRHLLRLLLELSQRLILLDELVLEHLHFFVSNHNRLPEHVAKHVHHRGQSIDDIGARGRRRVILIVGERRLQQGHDIRSAVMFVVILLARVPRLEGASLLVAGLVVIRRRRLVGVRRGRREGTVDSPFRQESGKAFL